MSKNSARHVLRPLPEEIFLQIFKLSQNFQLSPQTLPEKHVWGRGGAWGCSKNSSIWNLERDQSHTCQTVLSGTWVILRWSRSAPHRSPGVLELKVSVGEATSDKIARSNIKPIGSQQSLSVYAKTIQNILKRQTMKRWDVNIFWLSLSGEKKETTLPVTPNPHDLTVHIFLGRLDSLLEQRPKKGWKINGGQIK